MIRILLLAFILCPFIGQSQMVSIADAREIDADGVMVRLDQAATVEGLTVGFNFRPGGMTWVVYDDTDNIGLNVFNAADDLGYTFKEGDQVEITGVLAQFNGLCQIIAESIIVVSEGNAIPDAVGVAGLDENSESKLVKIDNVTLVDPSQWLLSGSFNVDVTNGITINQVRIDSDTDISGKGAPTGVFSITGVGGQFDAESPYFEGYQLLPRSAADIDPYIEDGVEYTPMTIVEAREVDENGVSIQDGQSVQLNGFVLGINFRPGGLQFALVDEDNVGIGVFSLDDDFGYSVVEGENVIIQGNISQFNGLTQINVDLISPLDGDLITIIPNVVTNLSEDTESSLTKVEGVTYVDPSQWLGDGSSFNVDLTDGLNTIVMRIDSDTEMASMPAPLDISGVTGVGGQFDNLEPFLEGYQLLPRYMSDIDVMLDINDVLSKYNVTIYPNPTSDIIYIDSEHNVESVEIHSLDGKKLIEGSKETVNIENLESGNYLLKFVINNEVIHYPVMKM